MTTVNQTVVLLHGIFRTKRSMHALATAFAAKGYTVFNIDYPSRKMSIESLADYVYQQINSSPYAQHQLHFVTHSMGGLIVRELLARYQFNHIGNIVMIGPPNHGSEVADFYQPFFLYRFLYGPSGQQLTTRHASASPFPLLSHAFGVIAGDLCLDPLHYFLLPNRSRKPLGGLWRWIDRLHKWKLESPGSLSFSP